MEHDELRVATISEYMKLSHENLQALLVSVRSDIVCNVVMHNANVDAAKMCLTR